MAERPNGVIPPLVGRCNSWIIVHPFKEKALRETWNGRLAQECLDKGYRVFTALEWLQRFNQGIREGK